MTEQRHFHRVPFDGLVEFQSGLSTQMAELLDISLHGALIANFTGTRPQAGNRCRLSLALDDDGTACIVMEGIVAHVHGTRVGVECTSIDVDSITHLRRLLEMNLGDASLINRDLRALNQGC
ncbi:MAG: PilZ domain-containing protein [Gammaproteobacteria bacterium]|jgi:hypothetical protein